MLTLSKIERILSQRLSHGDPGLGDLPDPGRFKDMHKAVERIASALQRGERIVLIGDYDVDGVVSTSIMRLFFQEIGHDLEWIIPNRFRDGYGLSSTLLTRIGKADLILTVDNGISACEAADLCRSQGTDLIITDHHIVPEVPPRAYAVVNPKQSECTFPFPDICGAQIAWYLCAALNRHLGAGIDLRRYLDLVAIAVVADVMPMQGINRAMVDYGLRRFPTSSRACIQVYRDRWNKREYRAEDLAFTLAPVLNSAGRMEEASLASDFLCARDLREARRIFQTLLSYNERRKSMETAIFSEACEQVDPKDRVLVVAGEEWHEGVLGIVAARLAERYRRPAIVLTRSREGYKGSGRSGGFCDLFALVDSRRDLLKGFGGHKAAIGLSLDADALGGFRRALNEAAELRCRDQASDDGALLGELPFELIGEELYELLRRYEPYGESYPRPRFRIRGVTVDAARSLGKEVLHAKYLLRRGDHRIEGIQFRASDLLASGQTVDLECSLDEQEFRGRRTLQLLIDNIYITNNKI